MTSTARDPLTEVLALLRPEAALAAELRARGRWNLAFEASRTDVKFGFVAEGECLFAVQGRAPRTLRAGDVFLLGAVPPYVVASDMSAPSESGSRLLHGTRKRIVRIGGARDEPLTHVIGGRFLLEATNAHLLVEALPAFVHIPAHDAGPLRDVTRLLVDEVSSTQVGRARVLDQLAQLVLGYALRWLEASGKRPARAGWLRALTDARIGAALRHLHANVARGTSLVDLARVAGMSRTAFVARFKELVGRPPLAYAIAWRMALAKEALKTADGAIGPMAFELGYESESAFSAAFRREVGCSPRAYRDANRARSGR